MATGDPPDRDENDLVGQILEALRIPMLALDAEQRVVRANASFRAILGLGDQDLRGRHVTELGDGWDTREMREALASIGAAPLRGFLVDLGAGGEASRAYLLDGRRLDGLPGALLSLEAADRAPMAGRRLATRAAVLEREISRRESCLEILNEITRAANEADSAEEAIAVALRAICEGNSWEAGHAWVPSDDGSGSLVSTREWYAREGRDFSALQRVSLETRLRIDEGFPGAVLERGEPVHVADIDGFDDWSRGLARDLGVRSVAGVPVTLNGEGVAVLEFFHREPMGREHALMDILPDVAAQIGHVIERQHLERLLASRTDQEQQTLAQDLHDDLGSQLSALAMIATNLSRSLSREGSPRSEAASRLADGLEEAKKQIRALSRGLMPIEIDADSLRYALERLARTTGLAYPDLAVGFDCRGAVIVEDRFAATQIYRIAQEALHNAARHADADSVFVGLDGNDGLSLTVRDDGRGLPEPLPAGSRSGLRIMRHRASMIGARLSIETAPGRGTTVRCALARPRGPRRRQGRS